jgi:hypothetical protein
MGANMDCSGVFVHGDTKEEKKRWAASRVYQTGRVYACANTSDIFIRHKRLWRKGDPRDGGVYIELKFAEGRGLRAS